MINDVLTGIDELIDDLYKCADNYADKIDRNALTEESPYVLLLKAATTIDILAERIIDLEDKSGLRVYRLELELSAKQSDIDYLKSRLDASDIGYVSHD